MGPNTPGQRPYTPSITTRRTTRKNPTPQNPNSTAPPGTPRAHTSNKRPSEDVLDKNASPQKNRPRKNIRTLQSPTPSPTLEVTTQNPYRHADEEEEEGIIADDLRAPNNQSTTELQQNLRQKVQDIAEILNYLPTNATIDPFTQSACRDLFLRILGEDPPTITEDVETVQVMVAKQMGDFGKMIQTIETQIAEITKHMPGTTPTPTNSSRTPSPNTTPPTPNNQQPKPAYGTKPPANPLNAHHPTRLLVQILPNGLEPSARPQANVE